MTKLSKLMKEMHVSNKALSFQTGYSVSYIEKVKYGQEPGGDGFWKEVKRVLDWHGKKRFKMAEIKGRVEDIT